MERDWGGLGRDTAFFLGYQLLAAGVWFLTPESVSKWTTEQRKTSLQQWWENVQHPQWDPDNWYVNYLGHPYFGAIAYVRARERRFGAFGGFWYAALISGLYEFGIEALFERPSYQDLIVTPVGGLLLGALLFEPIREYIQGKPQLRWYDHLTLAVTDPLGTANSLLERSLGIEPDIRVQFRPPPWRRMHRSTSRAPGRSTGRRNSTAGPLGLASNSSLRARSDRLHQAPEGSRAWSMVIAKEMRKISATVSDHQVGFVVFGACIPF